MEEMQEKVRFCVDPKSVLVKLAALVMGLSIIFRVIGCWGLWSDQVFLNTQIILPLACNVLYLFCLLVLGRKAFWTTSVPALFGVLFFIIKAFTFESLLHTILCVMLYLLVAVIYTGTAFGAIRTKWLLVPLFGLPLIYHLAVEDRIALVAGTFTLQTGLQELSVLCIMISLLLTAFALKKKAPEGFPRDLPKIKAPKVIVPGKKPVPEEPSPDMPAPPERPEPLEKPLENENETFEH